MGLKELEFKNDLDMLFQAILELENIDECYKFFEDIATITELKAISQRIQVAKMLREKRVYTEIAEATGASTATISRVNKCLNYGQGGYDLVLDRINSKGK
ncbi:YerC/YecD family TrpR-related protein [uncultured Clostridium sp.]|uniref:YerC/YecD family TrpR-related protein n=1 Tax=uncultured Clostridium sp. TaxID=59620 RepID=UPI0025DFB67F|nr:YerC/YecD family TrpR-related protein [uncultured Clostridium sp.]